MLAKFLRMYHKLSEPSEPRVALANENRFFALLSMCTMYFGAIVSFLTRIYLYEETWKVPLRDSMILFLFGSVYYIGGYLKNEIVKMYLYAFTSAGVMAFSYAAFYSLIGPGVYSIAFLIVILLLVYSRQEILTIYLLAILITALLDWSQNDDFSAWDRYHPANTMIIGTLGLLVIGVFHVLKSRQYIIQKQYEEILLSSDKLKMTLRSVGDGVITVDEKGLIEYLNPVAENLTGWKREAAKGQRFEIVFRIIHEKTRETVDSPVQKVLETKEIVELANHTVLVSKDGSERPIEDTAAPILDKEGNLFGVVLVFRDCTQKKEKRREIELQSISDPLTGLYNRRYFERQLINLDHPRNYPLSVVFVDVNGLKIINDAFGHEYGDQLITEVATTLKSSCRSDDILARVGGDEFILLLPRTEETFVEELIQRMQGSLEAKKIMGISIGASFGYGCKKSEDQETELVIKNAEDMMYQKKIFAITTRRSSTIESIYETLFLRLPEEKTHAEIVMSLAERMGRSYGFQEDKLEELKLAAKLHDIGKIAINKKILRKRIPLSDAEWTQIQHHPETGYRLLSTTKEFFMIANSVLDHHERWDGKGYPKGLKEEKIDFNARIIAVCEAFAAMTSMESYQDPVSEEKALGFLREKAGTQFDPKVVECFIALFHRS